MMNAWMIRPNGQETTRSKQRNTIPEGERLPSPPLASPRETNTPRHENTTSGLVITRARPSQLVVHQEEKPRNKSLNKPHRKTPVKRTIPLIRQSSPSSIHGQQQQLSTTTNERINKCKTLHRFMFDSGKTVAVYRILSVFVLSVVVDSGRLYLVVPGTATRVCPKPDVNCCCCCC